MPLPEIQVFGVRHLSPAGAWHLRALLNEVEPEAVLIEVMSDTASLADEIVRPDAEPPIAILAYTADLPVRTVLSPLATYSPEYQAMRWAVENGKRIEFIDLPSDVFLALDAVSPMNEDAQGDDPGGAEPDEADSKEPAVTRAPSPSLYERLAEAAGEPDYDTYWERSFEHNPASGWYQRGAMELGHGLRALDLDAPLWRAENLVREAYMRRRIREVIDAGFPAHKVVAVVGAYHAPVLTGEHAPMTDDELARLPRRPSKLTLMPYSYYRLSSQSGYGAGNSAPAYFQLMWEALDTNDLPSLATRYLTAVARNVRTSGSHRSTAEVIEGVRLANTLSALKGGLAPTLRDLHDAATTLLGHGNPSAVSEAVARVDVGTAIGHLPLGISKTSIQDDFDRWLSNLKLEKYRSTVRQDLVLDLRENRLAKTPEAAFLDLRRSSFLHRLRVLGVSFATLAQAGSDAATWKEVWHLRWTPDSEIELVEAVLLGETVEVATDDKLKSQLGACQSVSHAADIVLTAGQCGLWAAMDRARVQLQALSAAVSDFRAIAEAAAQLGTIVRYGDVRQFDPTPLKPLLADLFVQGALGLWTAAAGNDAAAREVLVGIDGLNKISLDYHALVDDDLWTAELRKLADADDRNPLLSGYACAILLERNLISNEDLARDVSRRISPGVSADLGAGWFEGVSKRNRYALITRQRLWEQLARYIASLDDEQFTRAVVFLRRAFGGFSPAEKRQVAENLGEHWGLHAVAAVEALDDELTEDEEQALAELNEFDFGDL